VTKKTKRKNEANRPRRRWRWMGVAALLALLVWSWPLLDQTLKRVTGTASCAWYNRYTNQWVYQISPEAPLSDIQVFTRGRAVGMDAYVSGRQRCYIATRVSSNGGNRAYAGRHPSPDGNYFVFAGVLGREGYNVRSTEVAIWEQFNLRDYLVETETGTVYEINGAENRFIDWSPDSRAALFDTIGARDDALIAYDVTTHTVREIPIPGGVTDHVWLDEQTLVMSLLAPGEWSEDCGQPARLVRVDLDTAAMTVGTAFCDQIYSLALGADDRTFAFTRGVRNENGAFTNVMCTLDVETMDHTCESSE